MQTLRFGFAFLAGSILAVSASGCAPQGGQSQQPDGGKGPAITSDPQAMQSTGQWGVYEPAYENGYRAGIADPTRVLNLGVGCSPQNPKFRVTISALQRPPGLESPTMD